MMPTLKPGHELEMVNEVLVVRQIKAPIVIIWMATTVITAMIMTVMMKKE